MFQPGYVFPRRRAVTLLVNVPPLILQEVELEVAEVFGSQLDTYVATALYLLAEGLETPTVQLLAEVAQAVELPSTCQSKTSTEVASMPWAV